MNNYGRFNYVASPSPGFKEKVCVEAAGIDCARRVALEVISRIHVPLLPLPGTSGHLVKEVVAVGFCCLSHVRGGGDGERDACVKHAQLLEIRVRGCKEKR